MKPLRLGYNRAPQMSDPASFRSARFGDFELDVAAYELRRRGRRVRLERLAMDFLILLVKRPGQLVTRAEIVEQLWGKDVFVEVDAGVNTLVRKLRRALGDAVDHPRFIETVQGKGYRFTANVELDPEPRMYSPARSRRDSSPQVPVVEPEASNPITARRRRIAAWPLALAGIAILGWLVWGRSTAGTEPIRVAVMPFENMGNGIERDYVTDGLTEETAASLGQVVDADRVLVLGRMSTRAYKETTRSIAEIGHALAASYLVIGSVRAEGGRLRVTSALVRVSDQEQVWSKSYEREPQSMLTMQQELGEAVAREVGLRLQPERVHGLAQRQTGNADAYDFYLRGRHLGNQLTPAASQRALEAYGRATTIDPDYALAWSGIADALTQGTISGDARPLSVQGRVRDAAARASKAGPMLAETHTTIALQHFFLDWDWRRSEAAFRKAIEIDRRHAMAHRVLGVVLSHMNRPDDARAELKRGLELEPGHAINYALSAMAEIHAGDMDAALQYARRAVALDAEFWAARYHLAQVYEQLGQSDRALEEIGIGARLSNSNSKALSLRGYILARTGRRVEALDVLGVLEQLSRTRYVPPYARALVYAGLDERDATFEWLENALVERDVHLIFLPVDPKWKRFRDDPRFQSIVNRCGFMMPLRRARS